MWLKRTLEEHLCFQKSEEISSRWQQPGRNFFPKKIFPNIQVLNSLGKVCWGRLSVQMMETHGSAATGGSGCVRRQSPGTHGLWPGMSGGSRAGTTRLFPGEHHRGSMAGPGTACPAPAGTTRALPAPVGVRWKRCRRRVRPAQPGYTARSCRPPALRGCRRGTAEGRQRDSRGTAQGRQRDSPGTAQGQKRDSPGTARQRRGRGRAACPPLPGRWCRLPGAPCSWRCSPPGWPPRAGERGEGGEGREGENRAPLPLSRRVRVPPLPAGAGAPLNARDVRGSLPRPLRGRCPEPLPRRSHTAAGDSCSGKSDTLSDGPKGGTAAPSVERGEHLQFLVCQHKRALHKQPVITGVGFHGDRYALETERDFEKGSVKPLTPDQAIPVFALPVLQKQKCCSKGIARKRKVHRNCIWSLQDVAWFISLVLDPWMEMFVINKWQCAIPAHARLLSGQLLRNWKFMNSRPALMS